MTADRQTDGKTEFAVSISRSERFPCGSAINIHFTTKWGLVVAFFLSRRQSLDRDSLSARFFDGLLID